MPKSDNQKAKLLYILKILWEETDEEHRLSTPEIIERLDQYGISAERKSVYDDLTVLEDFGFDIGRGRAGCCILSRSFELPELKLLVDAVQSSKFITAKKSSQLISKLSALTGRHSAMMLNRTVYADGKAKAENESIYINVDMIYAAMAENRRIFFRYFEWTPQRKRLIKNEGQPYEVSPWGLIWDDENYYLLGFDARTDIIKHFRVDKMLNIEKSKNPREGQESFGRLDLSQYSRRIFGMFGGTDDVVVLECENRLAGVIIDRFGTDASIFPGTDGKFTAAVNIKVSNNFFSWVLQFGTRMKIINPPAVVRGMNKLLNDVSEIYNDGNKSHNPLLSEKEQQNSIASPHKKTE